MTDTEVTFLSCYNTVGHTRMYDMTLTSPPSLPLSSPWAGLNMRRFMSSHLLFQGSPLLSILPYSLSVLWKFKNSTLSISTRLPTIARILPGHTGQDPCLLCTLISLPSLRICQTLRFLSSQFCRTHRIVFRQQYHPCSCTRIMTLASSPPSIRCSPFGTRVSSISFLST